MSPALLDLFELHAYFVYVFFFSLRFLFFVCVLPEYMYVLHLCALCLERSEKCVGSSKIGITGSCGPPCWCWESNLGPGPLQEQ